MNTDDKRYKPNPDDIELYRHLPWTYGDEFALRLVDALDSVVWYNGLGEYVLSWLELEPNNDSIPCPYFEYPDKDIWNSLEPIWMICVCLFGDYGTSPRSGWIHNVRGFRDFIESITYTYRQS